MKQEKIIITVPKPCSENWAEMTVADKGRYCAACQKTVIDFSVLTDREIIDTFKKAQGQPCGRFYAGQLGRELVVPQKQSFSFILLKRLAAGLLFFQSVAATAWAQTGKPRTQQEQKKPGTAPTADKKSGINGSVSDYATNTPLAGMMVQIAGTEIKTFTNKTGSFYLPLPDSFKQAKFTVTASYSESSAKPLNGTTIVSEEVYMDSLPPQVNIYRYPVDILDAEELKANKPAAYFMGGGMARSTYTVTSETRVKKHRRWLFFGKRKGNDE